MPSYLVESYAASSAAAVEEVRERARRAAELESGVRYLRTTYLPADETILHLFEAPSAEVLGRAARRARLAFDRIVEAMDAPAISQTDCGV
jgi:hypothetical protein